MRNVVSVKLRDQFQKEIQDYASTIASVLKGEGIFKDLAQLPSINTNDILKKYIQLGIIDLQASGSNKVQARCTSRHIFEKLLEESMTSISG